MVFDVNVIFAFVEFLVALHYVVIVSVIKTDTSYFRNLFAFKILPVVFICIMALSGLQRLNIITIN